jgi:hypothetical protein
MPTLDASPLGTKCCTHKLVKWYCELILNPQDRRSEHLLITVGNGEINPLPPNEIYMCRTTPLTSRHCILNIYSTYIRTEYLLHNLCFSLFKIPFIS